MKPTKLFLVLSGLFVSKKTLVFFIFCLTTFFAHANDSIYVFGRVVDSFTYELLHPIKIDVLTPDSTVIVGDLESYEFANFMERNVNCIISLGREHRDVILRFRANGYDIGYQDVHLSGNKRALYFPFEDVKLRRMSTINLDDVEIVATQIRMVMRGDTIVYNADAFQLSQGSMLDELVRKLPGVQLDGGRITVNGRFVSSLLLNGENFFTGDPKVALDNLPAYMVDKVKVYDKSPEHDYITGKEVLEELPLVMDVQLKREYNTGWIANAEAGYGTHGRWLVQAFGLRFTDNTRLALFGNVNNINDTREPGTSGNWNSGWLANGLTDMRYGGVELLLKDKQDTWKLNSYVKGLYEGINHESKASAVNFLESGDTYQRIAKNSYMRRNKLISHHNLDLKYPQSYVNIKAYTEYADGNTDQLEQSAEFRDNPKEGYGHSILDTLFCSIKSEFVDRSLINGYSNAELARQRMFRGELKGEAYIKIGNLPDYVTVNFVGNYRNILNTSYSHYDLLSGNGGRSFQNRYSDHPEVRIDASPTVTYNLDLPVGEKKLRLIPSYKLQYNYNQGNRNYYRLDYLDGWNTADAAPELGQLPSNNSLMQAALDATNSYHSQQTTLSHLASLSVGYFLTDTRILAIRPQVHMQHDRLDYRRAHIDTVATRNYTSLGAALQFSDSDFKLTYGYTESKPTLLRLLDIRDDSNPLAIRLGNPDLKSTQAHQFNFHRYFTNEEKLRNITWRGEYNLYMNAIAQSLTYDPTTGVRTYQPKNINGNWDAGSSVDITQALNEDRSLILTSNTGVNYNNSVDYVAIDGMNESTKSCVRSLRINEGASLSYYDLSLKGNVQWLHAESQRAGFETLNCFDFYYGLSGYLNIGSLELSTDFTVYSRRGYADKYMNDDNLVWNIRAERSFLPKSNLIVAIEGFDILGQLSNVQRTLNAQGLVETWYNSIPQYAMLRVIYRLNREPKKK